MVTYSFALAIMQVDGLLGNLHLYPNFSHWVTVVKIIWKRLHLCWKLSHLVALCAYHRFQLAEWCMTVDCREVSRIGLLPPSRWHSTRIAPMSKCCPSVLKVSGKTLPKTPIFFLSDGSGSSITSKNFEIDLADGTKEIVSWSLANYLRVACIRYPSRACIYCVRIPPEHLDSQLLVYTYYVYNYANCLN